MINTRTGIQQMNAYRYRTSIGENGETLYDMPLEIESDADLQNYGITREDCCRISFGGTDVRIVYFYKTDNRELAEEQWRYLNRDHFAKVSITRCMVPGKRKALKRCPTCNSCRKCPYGKTESDKQLNVISWDRLTEDDSEHASYDGISKEAEEIDNFNLLMEDLQRELDKYDPRMMQILKLRFLMGYSTLEIAEKIGCTKEKVYVLIKTALKRAAKFFED